MGTINPRARGGASLSGDLRSSRDDRQQIRRLFQAQPKPKAPVAASGGIVGMAEVRSVDGSVVFRSGQVGMDYGGVSYGSVSDPFAGSPGAATSPVSSWLTVSGHELLLTPGWYNLTVSLRIRWTAQSSAPPALTLYMQGGWDVTHNDASYFALANVGNPGTPLWGIQQVSSHGPTFINSGDAVWVECRGSEVPSADNADGSVVWDITKLG